MEKLIYAFDFDGTLCDSNFPECGTKIDKIFDFALKVKKEGHYIILWTCRVDDALEKAVKWCEDNGLVFDAVNDNLEHMCKCFGNNSRKIFANYYVDDRNWRKENWIG